MALNPLAPVTDYQSMLSRVFWFTSAAALGSLCLLRTNVPLIDGVLSDFEPKLGSDPESLIPVPAGMLLPALAVGLLARVFRMHSRVANWLGIRERFEIDVIIAGLARESNVDLAAVSEEQWQAKRYDIMRDAFYRFASSESPQIDPHLIHQALDCWSWFWSGLEATVVFVLCGFVLISFGAYAPGGITILLALALSLGGLPLIRQQCRRYAIAQVKAIVSDGGRAAQVQQAFEGMPQIESPLQKSA